MRVAMSNDLAFTRFFCFMIYDLLIGDNLKCNVCLHFTLNLNIPKDRVSRFPLFPFTHSKIIQQVLLKRKYTKRDISQNQF